MHIYCYCTGSLGDNWVEGPTGLSINQRANGNPALSTVYLMTIHDAVCQYAKGMQRFLVSAVRALES